MVPRVFLDTTVLKLAATRVVRGFRRQAGIVWGGREHSIEVRQFRSIPKVPIAGTPQRADASLLPYIARLAGRRRVELLWHVDGVIEFWRLPDTDSPDGRFFGAPLTCVEAPVTARRIIAGGVRSMHEHQIDFLRGIRDPRYLGLQIAVGVKEGAKNYNNQLLDAFHIWCAERAGARYFVTTDYALIRHLVSHRLHQPVVDVVTPRELLADLRRRREISYLDRLDARVQQLRCRIFPGTRSGLDDLVALGEHLERQGYYQT